MSACPLCQPPIDDAALGRIPVWEDRLWRVAVSLAGPLPGRCVLEPKRHIPSVAELDGDEAATLGWVLAWASAALRSEAGARRIGLSAAGDSHMGLLLDPQGTAAGEVREPGAGEPEAPGAGEPGDEAEQIRAFAARLRERLSAAPPPTRESGDFGPILPWVPRPPERRPELPPPWPDEPETPEVPDDPFRPRPRPNDPWW
jgi:hypothetical protein